MMLSEEELVQCLQSVAGPKPTPPPVYPDLYPSQCHQGLLRKVLREVVKHPECKAVKEVKDVLQKIKAKKKIPKGNHGLETVLQLICPPPTAPPSPPQPEEVVNPSERSSDPPRVRPPRLVDSPVSQEEKYLEA